MKPFYIYTSNSSLFIKNINDKKIKIASNIYTYTVYIDKFDNINIICVDNFGKIILITKQNKKWRKKVVGKFFKNLNQIEEITCFYVDNSFNLFVIEKSFFIKDFYKIYHINFSNSKNITLSKNVFFDVIKFNKIIYDINIDNNCLIFEYYKKENNKNIYKIKSIFNSEQKTWNTTKNIN